jgi:hypothetical protein
MVSVAVKVTLYWSTGAVAEAEMVKGTGAEPLPARVAGFAAHDGSVTTAPPEFLTTQEMVSESEYPETGMEIAEIAAGVNRSFTVATPSTLPPSFE